MCRLRSALLSVILGLVVIPGWCQEPPRIVHLVTGDQYPPLSGRDLVGGGLATEIVVAAFERLELEVEVDFAPWKRGLEATKARRYFGTFPYVFTTDRHREFLYSAPLFEVESRIFVRADSELTNRSEIDGRPDLVECLPLGFPKEDAVKARLDPSGEAAETPADMTSCFQLILRGRADYFAIGEMLGWATVDSLGLPRGELRTLEGSSEIFSQHLIVPRIHPGAELLVQRFDDALAELRAAGEIDRLVARHTSLSKAHPQP